ncbi:MAG: autotransporter domain-containing protein [Halioglobus sp.]
MPNIFSRSLQIAGVLISFFVANIAMAQELSVSFTGLGEITSQPGAINCDQSGGEIDDCFQYNDSVTPLDLVLSATPEIGWQLNSWGGDCLASGANSTCSVSVPGFPEDPSAPPDNLFVTAVFDEQRLTVALGGSGVGSVSGIPCEGFPCDVPFGSASSITLNAAPGQASIFSGWSGAASCGTDASCTVAAGIVSVSAQFELDGDNDGVGDDNTDQCLMTPANEPVDSVGCSETQLDGDNDGVSDALDLCPNTPEGEEVDAQGCSTTELDEDLDGVLNPDDQCPSTPAGETVDGNGCSASQLDDDSDGVFNDADQCADTPAGETVDGNGCSASQLDDDGDGVSNDIDQCPNTPEGEAVDAQGCSNSEVDGDGDGVLNPDDVCPATPAGEPVDSQGCSASQLDDDNDGVFNDVDQCPATPAGEAADGNGCSASQLDDDGDGVSNDVDQCPVTPAGEPVDAQGCSATELDEDLDGVSNERDQCPVTPAGEAVDANGCSDTQLDDDDDGVTNDVDQCPATPLGESTNSDGCSDSQLDDDEDGVSNADDQCPQTPAGASVDGNGCSDSELDDDGDGVTNDLDQCPSTEPGSDVDDEGCADSQKDSDGDGVNDEDDACPNSDPDLPVDDDGCSEVQQFGNELGDLPGLSKNEQSLGSRIDEICPQLIGLDVEEGLTSGQQQLRSACSRLKNRGTSQDQAGVALGQISLTELASLTQNAVQSGMTQVRGTQQRVGQVNAGGGKGVSVAGLNLRSGDQIVPAHVLESAFKGLLGMGASEDSFADFGKLGIYLQGDFDFGDRDETSRESGYDFDAWNVSVGADYRFTDSVYAGASLGLGEIEVDYARNGGESDISNWTLSTYAGWQITEHWFLDGMFNYGQSDFDTVRRISYTDVGGQFESSQKGKTDGDQIFLGLNTGYMFNREGWRFGPIASLTYLDGSIDGYTERAQGNSSDAWSFLVDDQDYKSLRVSAGGQLDYAISTSFGVLIPGVRATWVYENEDGAEQIGLRLANNPFAESSLESSQIIVETDGVDSNFLDASLNLSGQFVMGVSGYMSYQFYSSYDNYSQSGFTIGLRWDKPF